MTTDDHTPSKAPMTPPDFSKVCAGCESALTEHARVIEGYSFCPDCSEKHLRNYREAERENNQRRFLDYCQRGLLDDVFKRAGFQKSTASIEALNPGAWKAARTWNRENAFVFGPVGTGKTFLANSLLMQAFLRGATVGMVSARRFGKASDRFDEGGEILKQWRRADVLLIDDLDKCVWTPERLGALWELLDIRRGRQNTTIVTCNFDAKSLRDVLRESAGANHSLADACLDRLKPCVTIELRGGSLR